ncbi:MAG TPA: thioredoxin domain-containing protein, partial [Bacteroidota bacterium]
GTYFPPEDRHGRIGFPRLLTLLSEAYRNEHGKILENAAQVQQALHDRWTSESSSESFSDSMIDEVLEQILAELDTKYGGFGGAPKFPHSSSIELLLALFDSRSESRILDAVTLTLRTMARGGVYDQLGGGFHRYSTDERWIVPHFEKMLYDNAPLLMNYIHAYQATGDEVFRTVSLDIIRYLDSTLSDRNNGGFYASQDADVAPGDDGSYYTWSLAQANEILDPLEMQAIQLHFDIYEQGEMHHDPAQNVLYAAKSSDEVASLLHRPEHEVQHLLESAKRKMQRARELRKTPMVDRTIYANWNGMMICSFLEAYKVFGQVALLQFALKTLNRILIEHSNNNGIITHRSSSLGPECFLEDQIEIANALLAAFETTSDSRYVASADSLMRQAIEQFGDRVHGGFFDIPERQRAGGLLAVGTKPIQDSPVAGANSTAILVLNKLSTLTGKTFYTEFADKSLRHFSANVKSLGRFASQFHLALHEYLHPPPHVAIIATRGSTEGERLFATALRTYRPGKSVANYDPETRESLPAILKNSGKPYARPVAYVCSQFSCAPPVYDDAALMSTIQNFGRT